MLSKEEAAAILAAAQANRDKLNGCKRHLFNVGEPPYKFAARFECRNCGGSMDAVQAFRYCQGYKAAGGNPNDVIPDFE